jgi:hypothetical protein
MSYKPDRKYIVEIKDVTPSSVYGKGGYWFSNSSSGTPVAAETIGSFEIIQNDFAIDTSNNSAGYWFIPEAGTFSIRVKAVMIVNQTPAADDVYITGLNSNTNNPYSRNRNRDIHSIGTRLHVDYFRNDHTYSMAYNPNGAGEVLTTFHSIEHSWIQESTGNQGGNMYLFADRIDIYNGIVEEFLYQRIEITKL